ncbi:MAG: SWIM zinc finger family protein [Acidobacteria bacterium]|nr:SWIM zinc finger family protein [Acidobacteriota bacterium]
MSRWDRFDRFYPPQPPKLAPPEHGIRVKKIGATWWGRRWIESLERLSWNYTNRLARGRTYARAGRAHDLVVAPGKVTAHVTGSRRTPYRVTIRIATFSDAAWERAIGAMAARVVFAVELLSGRMPEQIDEAFHAARLSLFPAAERDLGTECSCPDWANPCKHVAATHYVLAEAFDKDPFLLFELRGRNREQVLDGLRRRRADADTAEPRAPQAEPVAAVSLEGIAPADYDAPRAALDRLRVRVEPPAAPAALLRQLGDPPSATIPLAELLAPVYQRAGELARELALRGSEPAPQPEPPPPPRKRGRAPR